jgi:hypothetical protein
VGSRRISTKKGLDTIAFDFDTSSLPDCAIIEGDVELILRCSAILERDEPEPPGTLACCPGPPRVPCGGLWTSQTSLTLPVGLFRRVTGIIEPGYVVPDSIARYVVTECAMEPDQTVLPITVNQSASVTIPFHKVNKTGISRYGIDFEPLAVTTSRYSLVLFDAMERQGGTPAQLRVRYRRPWSVTSNNSVQGTIIANTWDPADPLTISGALHDNNGVHCQQGDPIPNVDSLIVYVNQPDDPGAFFGQHRACSGTTRLAFAPGTNSQGQFSFTIQGGGPSWFTGPGQTQRASWLHLVFKKNNGQCWEVSAGNSSIYPLPGCASSPGVYGVLASPDLDGDLDVDSADQSLFESVLGLSAADHWQADFNHSGVTIDSSDLAYFAGRTGKNCSSQKVGGDTYDMNVRNLAIKEVSEILSEHGLDLRRVLALWDEMGLTYDRAAAAELVAHEKASSRRVE